MTRNAGRRTAVGAGLLLIALVMVAGAASLGRPAPGIAPAPGLLPPLRQTVEGITLTLQPLYADANRIVFTGTVALPPGTSPDQYTFFPDWLTPSLLVDDQGRSFPLIQPSYWTVDGKILGISRSRGSDFLLMFDLAGQDPRAALRLHLVTSLWNAGYSPLTRRYVGPFTFDFTMPVDPVRRVVDVQQTAEGTHGALTLQQVVVTRREARLVLRFANIPSGTGLSFGSLPIVLQAGDWSSAQHPDLEIYMGPLPTGLTWSFPVDLLAQPGPWTLAVRTVTGHYPASSGPAGALIGPWIFHFPVPPVGAAPLVCTPVVVPVQETATPLPPEPTFPAPIASFPYPVSTASYHTLPVPVASYPPMPVASPVASTGSAAQPPIAPLPTSYPGAPLPTPALTK
jgi:hypothetical protein